MFDPDRHQQERQDLAEALRRLRRASGLSGERLAARCAISQSKIGRIERGKILPSVIDVQRILDALDVPSEAAKPLLDLARVANVHYRSWRSYAETGLWRRQEELAALASSSTVMRHFTPAAPSGLLQTSEYARAILASGTDGKATLNIERALEARKRRQQSLLDPARRFVFVMTEQAVRWRLARPEVMSGQCAHMADLATNPNLTIAVVPNTANIDEPAFNSFTVHDERLVLIELFSGSMTLRDPKDIAYHINIIGHFVERALTGTDAADFLRATANEF